MLKERVDETETENKKTQDNTDCKACSLFEFAHDSASIESKAGRIANDGANV